MTEPAKSYSPRILANTIKAYASDSAKHSEFRVICVDPDKLVIALENSY